MKIIITILLNDVIVIKYFVINALICMHLKEENHVNKIRNINNNKLCKDDNNFFCLNCKIKICKHCCVEHDKHDIINYLDIAPNKKK